MSIETIDTLIVGGAPPKIAEKTCDMTISQSLVTNGFDYSVVNTRTLNNTAPLKFMPLTAPVRSMVLRVALIKEMANVLVVEAFVDHCKTASPKPFCVAARQVTGAATQIGCHQQPYVKKRPVSREPLYERPR